MGHRLGRENWRNRRCYARRNLSREEVIELENDPTMYRPEARPTSDNRVGEDTSPIPISVATGYEKYKSLIVLLNKGCDPDLPGGLPLLNACKIPYAEPAKRSLTRIFHEADNLADELREVNFFGRDWAVVGCRGSEVAGEADWDIAPPFRRCFSGAGDSTFEDLSRSEAFGHLPEECLPGEGTREVDADAPGIASDHRSNFDEG